MDASQEMVGLGLCNIFGSFVQSMPTTGSFSRWDNFSTGQVYNTSELLVYKCTIRVFTSSEHLKIKPFIL